MSPSELLQQLRRRYPSAAALARALSITRQALGMLIQGQRHPGDCTIIKAAALLGIDPGPALCMAAAARVQDPTTAAAWGRIAAQLSAHQPAQAPENPPAPPAAQINQAPESAALPAQEMPPECGDFYYVKYWWCVLP